MLAVIALVSAQPAHALRLERYVEAAKRVERLGQRFAASTEQQFQILKSPYDNGSYPPDRVAFVIRADAWRDGQRMRLQTRSVQRQMHLGKLVEESSADEALVTSDRAITVPLNASATRFEGTNLIANIGGDPEEQFVRELKSIGLFVFSGRIDVFSPPLSELLASAKTAVRNEVLEGQELTRVDFENEWGACSVWFDPRRDDYPVRVVQRKQSQHWIGPKVRLDSPPHFPNLGPKSESYTEIVLSGLRRVDGVWFPEQSAKTSRTRYANGQEYEEKVLNRVLSISWNPFERGNDFTIKTPIPEGARVVVEGQMPLMYEWRNGDIVKNVDPRVEAFLAQQSLPAQSHRWWLWPSVALAGALALGLGIWRYRKRAG